jgi:hypothetical protein
MIPAAMLFDSAHAAKCVVSVDLPEPPFVLTIAKRRIALSPSAR